jgi:hypothetical protein
MHGETLKHALKEKAGEDDIYDTAGMAVCLGVVKNYTMYKVEADSLMSCLLCIHQFIHSSVLPPCVLNSKP